MKFQIYFVKKKIGCFFKKKKKRCQETVLLFIWGGILND